MSTATLAFDIVGRDKASGAFGKVGKAADTSSSKMSKFSSGAKKAGKVLAGFAVVAGGVVVAGIFSATEAASDLSETISKVTVLFGKRSARSLESWAEGAAKKLGQSKQTALDAAATFGVFGKSAGLAGKDLANFAMENTQLAADMASFGNSTPEAAIEALGAAFRGEAEPIRQFGVLLDDATLKAQAMKMGLIKTTTEALTPQQKVLAAHRAILLQTKDAQGDFARTSGGLANQQRILKAQLQNTKAEIGQKLLPIMTKIATWINDEGIPAAEAFGRKVKEAFRKIREIVERVWGIVGPILTQWKDSIGGLGGAAKAVANGDYKSAMEKMADVTGRNTVHIAENFRSMYLRMIGTLGRMPGKFKDLAIKAVAGLVEGFRELPGLLKDVGLAAGKAIIEGLLSGLSASKHLVTDLAGNLAGDLMSAFKNPLGIHSPSRVFKRYGVHIMEGLELGIKQGQNKVESVLAKVLAAVQRYGEKLRDLTSRRSDVISGFTGGAESVFGASSTDAQGNSIAPTAAGLIAFQQQQRSQAVQLRSNVRKLLKMGLSRDLIRQMAAAGPSGYAQIAALAQGSAAQINQLNALNSQTNQALTGAGTLAGNALYAEQISKAKDQQDAAVAIAKELRKVMREANDNQQIVIKLEGRTLQMSLLQLKRQNGKPLGLS